MKTKNKEWFANFFGIGNKINNRKSDSACGCGKSEGGCNSSNPPKEEEVSVDGFDQVFDKQMGRRSAFKNLTASLLVGAGAVTSSCSVTKTKEEKEKSQN